MAELGFTGSRFIMGRSLGSASAIELASSYADEFRGIIVESGFCDISDLLGRVGVSLKLPGGGPYISPGFERVGSIRVPALIIHGEWDNIVPVAEGEKIYDHIGSSEKKLVVIKEADHNSIFAVGAEQYLQELSDFVARHK
jgi:alpha-beta hydrolase superfamily lysophospholipase